MKVAATSKSSNKKPEVIFPLLEDEDSYKLSKDNATLWELWTVPANNASPTYKLMVRVLEGNEMPQQIVRWWQDILKVCVGVNATDLNSRRPIMEACECPGPLNIYLATLRAHAEVAYQDALQVTEQTDQANGSNNATMAVRANGVDHHHHNDHLDIELQEVVTGLLPHKVLPKVKRNLHQDMRKPFDMRVWAPCPALMCINDEELPNLPPFRNRQFLSEDKVLNILLFGAPWSWQNEMDHQGFDPVEKGLLATVAFMENLKSVEDKPEFKEAKSKYKSDKSKKGKDFGENDSSKKKDPHHCKHHGPNCTHDMADCHILKKESTFCSCKVATFQFSQSCILSSFSKLHFSTLSKLQPFNFSKLHFSTFSKLHFSTFSKLQPFNFLKVASFNFLKVEVRISKVEMFITWAAMEVF